MSKAVIRGSKGKKKKGGDIPATRSVGPDHWKTMQMQLTEIPNNGSEEGAERKPPKHQETPRTKHHTVETGWFLARG